MAPKHHIKAWRKSKGLSLRRPADRLLNTENTPIISYASLSRIEKGEQDYTQPVLEGIAIALGTDPGSLLMRDPTQEKALYSIWDQIPETSRKQALQMLEGLAKTGS